MTKIPVLLPHRSGFGKSTVRIVEVSGTLPTLEVHSHGYAGNAVMDGRGGSLRRSPIRFKEAKRIEIPATGKCKKTTIAPRAGGPPGP